MTPSAQLIVLLISALLFPMMLCDRYDCAGSRDSGTCKWSCKECVTALQYMATLLTPGDNETEFVETFKNLMVWQQSCYSIEEMFHYSQDLPECCETGGLWGDERKDGREKCASKVWSHGLSNGVIDPLRACVVLDSCSVEEVTC
ncbi:hypothetical protein Ddc_24697 [Ditylenchus destructor]|nr:hypothetical protein Ddc_24697 [Ditylenchus destructor]